jgi:hypothetical protein
MGAPERSSSARCLTTWARPRTSSSSATLFTCGRGARSRVGAWVRVKHASRSECPAGTTARRRVNSLFQQLNGSHALPHHPPTHPPTHLLVGAAALGDGDGGKRHLALRPRLAAAALAAPQRGLHLACVLHAHRHFLPNQPLPAGGERRSETQEQAAGRVPERCVGVR